MVLEHVVKSIQILFSDKIKEGKNSNKQIGSEIAIKTTKLIKKNLLKKHKC